jgi:hypothetical protein
MKVGIRARAASGDAGTIGQQCGAGTAGAEAPWRDDAATMPCPVCQRLFTPSGRARYCGDACRKRAWRRRRSPPPVPVVVPPGRPRRPVTVYECSTCGARALGQQRCDDCGSFMARVGIGGLCPACLEPIAMEDLVGTELATPAPQPGTGGRTGTARSRS